jgi:DNA-binding CsgD family transcriptional regulator/tetratricopeptide (TPR) repeat protein
VATRGGLVGRDDERERLAVALVRCGSGSGGFVLVSGEAGVGKSRLVAEVVSAWDGRRLAATAVSGAGAFASFTSALRTELRTADPDLWRDDPRGAVVEACRSAARRGPAVLVVEDLHLADSATFEALPVFAEALEREPLLVVGVYRSDELPRGHPVRGLRAELRRTRRLVEITLRPLSQDQTGELLGVLLPAPPSPTLLAAVHGRAGGLPFFVVELAASLVDGGALEERAGALDLVADAGLPVPESVFDAVLAGTRDLREQHASAADYAAVLGVQVDLPALAALVGPVELDAVLEAGLLLERDTATATFRHGLVREALYRSIPWARRRSRHQHCAEVLALQGAPPAIVAEHWIAAHAPERARPLLLAAAEEHCAVHAYRDAAALVGRALALWPEGDDPPAHLAVLERLAECAELSGEAAAAAATWLDVARRRQASGDVGLVGVAHRRAANAADLLGDLALAAAERAAAADAFTCAGALADAAVERLALAGQLKAAGRLSESLEQAVSATGAAATAERRDVQAQALALQGAVRAALGEGTHGVRLARSGLELALAERLTAVAAETSYELAEALEYAADYASAADAYESAFELCRTNGLGDLARVCFVCLSPVVRLMGDWDRTLAICAEVLADHDGSALARSVAEEESGLITALRGDRRRARGPLRRAAEFGRDNGIFGLEVGATWGLAVVADLDEDTGAASRTVATLLDRCGSTQECHYALPTLRWAASFLSELGDREGASTCHRVVASLATRNSAPKVLSALAHVGAEVAMANGETGQACAQFARSIELLSGITAPYEHAHTQSRWGAALEASGDRTAAVVTVTSGYRTARRLRAKPLADRCARVLAHMGEPVDQRLGRLAARGLDVDGLTRREQEVLRHMADGKTNRDIAGTLYLSTRTVDMHVRNVLTKLDCSSRTTAVRRAAERGLIGR